MMDVLSREYVGALRADGIPQRSIIFKHALRNAALPVVTMIGVFFVAMLGGTVVVERVFVLPGLGSLVAQAAASSDLPVILGVTLLFTLIVTATNVLIDLAYGLLNPKARAA